MAPYMCYSKYKENQEKYRLFLISGKASSYLFPVPPALQMLDVG